MKRIGLIAIIVACLVVGVFTISKINEPKEAEPTTEVQIESTTEEELNIKISSTEPPTEFVIGTDGVVLSESEVEEERSKEVEEMLEEASIAAEEKREQETIATETISIDEMQEMESNIDAFVEAESIKMMRESAKTEVARYKSEGIEAFQNITDEMIDAYSEEELNNLMVLIYQNIKY